MGRNGRKIKYKNERHKYELSTLNNTIALGDCVDVLNDFPNKSIDLIFTSPPYFNARPEYKDYLDYEEYLLEIKKMLHESHRVLNEGRFFVMNISPVLLRRANRNESSKRIAVPFDFHKLFIDENFDFVDDIIWVKPEGAGWATGRGRRFAADRNPLQYKPVPVSEYVLVYRKRTNKLIDWNIRSYPKEIIHLVLCGENLRDSTEMLTRRRLGLLNAATLSFFIQGLSNDPAFVKELPSNAARQLIGKTSKEERWILEWLIGLTDKAFQNVIRDNPLNLQSYTQKYIKTSKDVTELCKKEYGDLKGELKLEQNSIDIDWNFVNELMTTIGSQTLAIRGSEKSTYGKLFEKLILGSVLSILGFKYVKKGNLKELKNVFWLSEREDKRESDATALIEPGKGIRFDIGFIGRGNPEISLDKVSRFEREMEYGRQKWYLTTIILVDRIGEKSRIDDLAKKIDAKIIQMSRSYWPKTLAIYLNKTTGFNHRLVSMPTEEVSKYIQKEISNVPFDKFFSK